MRDKKKWGALVLTVIMVAAITLSGCRKEREKIDVGTENTTLVSTESETETESESESETITEKITEAQSESETTSSESNNTQTESNSTNTGTTTTPSTTNTTNTDTTANTNNTTGTTNTGDTTGDSTGTGDTTGDTTGDNTTVETEAPRYFYDANGNRVDVSQLPDGSWQDANGTTYYFYENGVEDSNGVSYYYDPPSNGNTSDEVGTTADFYDTQGNHIICTMDENGNWVDSEGNTYVFGLDGVTDSNGNFHPY